MAIFPRIQSPCPYQADLTSILDGQMCRLCKREVFDLTALDDDARIAFMNGCKEEVCVSYSLPLRTALAAAVVLAASAAPMAAAAGEVAEVDIEYVVVVGGGIKDPSKVEYFDDGSDAALAALPVVYEEAAAPPVPKSVPVVPTADPQEES